MIKVRVVFGIAVISLLLALLGCGSGTISPIPERRGMPAISVDLQETLRQLDALLVPEGADPATFAGLKDALRKLLVARGTGKFTSVAPGSNRSQVNDLTVAADGVGARFQWSYRNEGDFNQDSIVNVSDLTPMGIHFGKDSAAPDWVTARVADGNRNGKVELGDLVSIGANFLYRVTRYSLQRSDTPDPGGTWTQVADIVFPTSTVSAGQLRQFDYLLSSPATGYYRVAPCDAALVGVPSNNVAVGTLTAPPGWTLVNIAAGTFTMGSPESEAGRWVDEVQHKVTLTKSYWLGKYEVTQGQYEELMGTNPSNHPGPNFPVEQVSWDDANAFLQQLTVRELAAGRLPAGWIYRLPTEAEWEYAARAGTTTAYFFGDDAGALGGYAWYFDNSGGLTFEVGLKDPNPWGLHDIYGNVYEWCSDWYGDYPIGDVIDPTGPDSGSGRVGRGGGWANESRYLRSAFRNEYGQGVHYFDLGFRVLAIQTTGP